MVIEKGINTHYWAFTVYLNSLDDKLKYTLLFVLLFIFPPFNYHF